MNVNKTLSPYSLYTEDGHSRYYKKLLFTKTQDVPECIAHQYLWNILTQKANSSHFEKKSEEITLSFIEQLWWKKEILFWPRRPFRNGLYPFS